MQFGRQDSATESSLFVRALVLTPVCRSQQFFCHQSLRAQCLSRCLCCSPGLAATQATHECTILARALDPGVLWPWVVAEANPQHRPDSLRKLWVNIAPCFWWQDTRSQRILTSFARTGTFKPLCLWPGIPRSLPTLPTGHHRADAIKCGFYRSHNKFRNSIIM